MHLSSVTFLALAELRAIPFPKTARICLVNVATHGSLKAVVPVEFSKKRVSLQATEEARETGEESCGTQHQLHVLSIELSLKPRASCGSV